MAITVVSDFVERANFFEFNLKYLMLVGLWPGEYWSKNQLKFYKIYEVTIQLQIFLYMVITGIGIYEHRNEGITLLLGNLDKSIVAYHFFFKTICFVANRKRLRVLIRNIVHSGDTMSKNRRQLMTVIVVVISLFCLSVVGSFSVVAQLDFEMPVEAWMPFDSKKSKMRLTIAAQILLILIFPSMCRILAMEGIVCSLAIYVCDQLIELQHRLRVLTFSHKNDNLMRQEFKEIVKKHIRLLG